MNFAENIFKFEKRGPSNAVRCNVMQSDPDQSVFSNDFVLLFPIFDFKLVTSRNLRICPKSKDF